MGAGRGGRGRGRKKSSSGLIEEEERNVGSVSKGSYQYYGAAMGWNKVGFMIFAQLLSRGLVVLAPFWVSVWADWSVKQCAPTAVDCVPEFGTNMYYLGLYAAINMAGIIVLSIRSLILAEGRVQ